jgi:hypothetical protein
MNMRSSNPKAYRLLAAFCKAASALSDRLLGKAVDSEVVIQIRSELLHIN